MESRSIPGFGKRVIASYDPEGSFHISVNMPTHQSQAAVIV